MAMRQLFFTLWALILWAPSAWTAPHFPELTGHVVDDAHILSPATVTALEEKLADYERGTTNQVVVVTLASLQGNSISQYGYQLGRFWKIGQKGKNNGVLFIVVPSERRMRIEVGYGLEPVLTDADSSLIITTIVAPLFRAGDMERGVIEGTDAILSVLGGKSIAMPAQQEQSQSSPASILFTLFFLFLFICLRAGGHPWLAFFALNEGMNRMGGERLGGTGWSGGSSFSGGGGSFGGGGASGSW